MIKEDYSFGQAWVPADEHLPAETGFYLVTKKQKTGAIHMTIAHYSGEFGWSGSGNMQNVLAWMPLPEPYKEADS